MAGIKPKEIIVHCTATVEGKNYTVEDVRRMHVQGRGWSDIGYHYLIYLDGTIHKGRPTTKVGAHCLGHNATSIGVCYVGGLDKNLKPKDTRTFEQKIALRALLQQLKKDYKMPDHCVHGHREFANKACPCFDARKEYYDI